MIVIGFGERIFVSNPRELNCDFITLMQIQTQINTWLNIMQEDAHFAVPEFMLEQIWNRLEMVITSSSLSEEP